MNSFFNNMQVNFREKSIKLDRTEELELEDLPLTFWDAMGLEASSLKGLESNEYLERLCGPESLSVLDPIWNKLFSHSVKPVLVR